MKKIAKKIGFMLLAVSMLSLSMVSAASAANTLKAGQSLMKGQMLQSHDSRYTLIMQTDGNLVHYNAGTPLWSTSTNGDSYQWYDSFLGRYYTRYPEKLVLTTTGTLKVTDLPEQFTFWQADTKAWMDQYYRVPFIYPTGLVGDTLITQNDGSVIFYDSRVGIDWPVWATTLLGRWL